MLFKYLQSIKNILISCSIQQLKRNSAGRKLLRFIHHLMCFHCCQNLQGLINLLNRRCNNTLPCFQKCIKSLTLQYCLAKALLHLAAHEEFQERGSDLFCRLIPSLGYHPTPPLNKPACNLTIQEETWKKKLEQGCFPTEPSTFSSSERHWKVKPSEKVIIRNFPWKEI